MAGLAERVNEEGREVLHLAEKEARQLNHNYIGTEHLLLGLVAFVEQHPASIVATVLDDLCEIARLREAVLFIIERGDHGIITDEIRLTPRSQQVLELALDESRRMRQPFVGAEQLLLGLLREGEGIAAGVLESVNVTLDRVRPEIDQLVPPPPPKVMFTHPAASRRREPEHPDVVWLRDYIDDPSVPDAAKQSLAKIARAIVQDENLRRISGSDNAGS